jgi:hypothetical protein
LLTSLPLAASATPAQLLSPVGDSPVSDPLRPLPDKSNESTPKKLAKPSQLQNSAKNSQNAQKLEKLQKTDKTEKIDKIGKDLTYKEHAIKYLLGGQHNDLIKNEDGQKSIELNDEDQQNIKNIEQFLDRLESGDLQFRYCRLCECILINHSSHEYVQPEPTGTPGSPLVNEESFHEAEETNMEAEHEFIRDHVVAHVQSNK